MKEASATAEIELIDLLRQGYGLIVAGLQPMSGGYLHETWRAETTGAPLFVKVYAGPDWPRKRVQGTLAVQQRLAAAGLPVPGVRLTLDGELTATIPPASEPAPQGAAAAEAAGPAAGCATVAVMEYLPGRTLAELPPEAARSAGSVLGRLHRALGTMPAGSSALPDREAILRAAQEVLTAVGGRDQPDEMDLLAAEAAQYRLDSLQAGRLSPSDYDGAVWQFIHGDYYPGNLLWSDDLRLTGVVDFDFCGPRWRGVEVGRAAVESALSPEGAFCRPAAVAFLQGYFMENPLSPAERQGMFRLWYNHLLGSLYPLSLRYRPGQTLPHGWEQLARRRHSLLLWLGEHLEALDGLVTQ